MANKFWVGLSSTSWNNTLNWALISGGVGGAGVPSNTDDTILDNGSLATCAITTASMSAQSITITSGFPFTFNVNATIAVSGDVNYGTGGWTLSGTSVMTLNSNSTFTTNGKTITHPITIGANLTLTQVDNMQLNSTFNITSGFNCTLTGSSTYSINCSGLTLPATSGITLLGDFISRGSITSNGSFGQVSSVAGTSNLYVGGSWTIGNNGISASNTTVIFNGTGSIGTGAGVGAYVMGLTINTPGTITFTSIIPYRGIFTYIIGNVVTAAVSIIGDSTFTTAGMTFATVNTTNASVVNLVNTLASSTITLSDNITFTGSSGFVCNSFASTTSGLTHILVSGSTYSINTNLNLRGTFASPTTLKSSISGSYSKFILNSNAAQSVSFITATDIDSSAAQTVFCWTPTLTRTLNWSSLLAQPTRIYNIYG